MSETTARYATPSPSRARTNADKSTPFASGGRTRDGLEWLGPQVLPELYTPSERYDRKFTLQQATSLAEWQVEQKLSKTARMMWDGTLVHRNIPAPEAPLSRQALNEYAELLSTATVSTVNSASAIASRRW